jgi:mono/diheme cytochrome c family protein
MTKSSTHTTLRITAATLVLLALGVQFVPYGHGRSNPPVLQEPEWDRPSTRALVARACFDCHSNETRWPWYSQVAPVSWLVREHVEEGRDKLNFSEWNRSNQEADEAAEAVSKGEMPLASYLLLHPSARLSPDEKRAIIRGLDATIGSKHGED